MPNMGELTVKVDIPATLDEATRDAIRRIAAALPPLEVGAPIRPEDIERLQSTGMLRIPIQAGGLAFSFVLLYRKNWPAHLFADRD